MVRQVTCDCKECGTCGTAGGVAYLEVEEPVLHLMQPQGTQVMALVKSRMV